MRLFSILVLIVVVAVAGAAHYCDLPVPTTTPRSTPGPTLTPPTPCVDLLIPVGRSFLGESGFVLYVNDDPYEAESFHDGFGGYWLKIPFSSLPQKSEVTIQFTKRRDDNPQFFYEKGIDRNMWLRPSDLIDSDNSELKERAKEIVSGCENCENITEKAKQIQKFVISHLTFKTYEGIPNKKASETYDRKFGVCIDYSRLFVALCRSANIPARTVEGIVYSREDPNIYDCHHEWAEFLDEDGNWHQLDFTYTGSFDLSDIRYLDLIYAPEENPYIKPFYITGHKPYQISSGDVVLYSFGAAIHNGLLGLGFELIEENHPEFYKIENRFQIEIMNNSIAITNKKHTWGGKINIKNERLHPSSICLTGLSVRAFYRSLYRRIQLKIDPYPRA